ncbi:GNAT family N-acetyltransferase [Salipiger mucosus]|uniref:N-acetyltransferase domain-containing protein n=1 Tax=Salipiger mucosus DSM 16094 TaxID=1123237 RepID=S9QEU3_9RHOB|nr:GNAT family N-acetyltransferase [Salipiger mucosus]EPX78073.1 hypothetical protein Salmuc_03395 [Salipiger mucosus DSM 16094]
MDDLETSYRFERWDGVAFGDRYAFQQTNADIQDRLKYFVSNYIDDHLHFIAVAPDDLVVGIAALQQSPYDEGLYWLPYVTVDADHRGQGLGRKLFMQAVEQAHDAGKTLELSTLEEDGRLYLANAIRDAQRRFPGGLKRIPEDLVVVDDSADPDESVAPGGP